MSPLCTYADQKVQNALFQAAAIGAPATWYAGLLVAPTWVLSTAYTAGQYVVGTAFASTNRHVYKCTTAGTTGSTEPTWTQTAGGTTTDGTVTWTECTNLFQAGTFTGAEQSGSAYARVAITANSTNFSAATSAVPSVTQNATAIAFPTPSASWGQAVALVMADASTAGNIWNWGLLTSAVVAGSGSSPSVAIDGFSWTLE